MLKREVVRALVLSAFGALALFWATIVIVFWGMQPSIYGWNLGPDGKTLIYVTPHKPAYDAGIRAGDRIDWRNLNILGRANLGIVQAVLPDSRLPVTVYRNGHARTVTLTPVPWEAVVANGQRTNTIVGLILVAIGIGLVYLRPTRMTWGFLLASLAAASPQYVTFWGQSSAWKFALANTYIAVLTGTAAAGILMFMSRFPSDRARGPLIVFDRAAVPLGVGAFLLSVYVVFVTLLSAEPPPAWAVFAVEYLVEIVIVFIALGAVITAYVLTKGSDRQRIVPVLLTFAFFVGSLMAMTIYNARYTEPAGVATLLIVRACAMLALAAAVMNGVIRHRVIDVSFVISRTLVYTVLTSIIVGAFALIDFVSSKMLERFQITIAIEALAALAFGIWMNALHSRIDRFVDRVLFKRRHIAEARLDRTARAMVHAESTPFIDEALVIEACEALALASAAVFRRDGSELYNRVLSRGWDDAHVHSVTSEDHLVVNLLGDLQSLDLTEVRWPHHDVPHGIAQPILAVPLCVRHELLGFVLYSGHVGGEAIDPDEKRALTRLADAASAAYEHVRSKALVSEAEGLRNENTLLQREQQYMRETIDTLRSVARGVER